MIVFVLFFAVLALVAVTLISSFMDSTRKRS
jgi:hypothetical protein